MKHIAVLVTEVWDQSAPPQCPGGFADTLTSFFSEPPCAPVPADMHYARCVGRLGTPGLPRV